MVIDITFELVGEGQASYLIGGIVDRQGVTESNLLVIEVKIRPFKPVLRLCWPQY